MKGYWLSGALLVLAYATFGQLLHATDAKESIWLATLALPIVQASLLTLFWKPFRNLALIGFQSDIGYSVMVLALASLTVLAVVQLRAFSYVIVLVATAILVRVDCLLISMSDRLAFLTLVLLSLAGLSLSWLPLLFLHGVEPVWSPQPSWLLKSVF